MTVTIDGSAGITTPGVTDTGSLSVSGAATITGNTTISGSGNKILGDFSNATVANRNNFQTSTTNGSTGIYALPNGTSTAASWQATNNADPTNASKILIATNGSTDVQLVSGINGTGTYLPLSFYTNGTQQMQLSTAGILTGTAGNLMLIQGTAQASTSGTSIAFTGIPSWAKRITISFAGVTNTNAGTVANALMIVQLGTGATPTWVTSGYVGNIDNRVNTIQQTTGFGVNYSTSSVATYVNSGQMILCLNNGNTWTETVTSCATTAGLYSSFGAGYVALGAALTAVRVTTVGGTDTFTAGSINIQYE